MQGKEPCVNFMHASCISEVHMRRALISHHAQHTSLDCASNDSHSTRVLMASPYPVALTAGFDGNQSPLMGAGDW